MTTLLMVLVFCGGLISFVGSVLFLVAGFRQSVLWGVAILLIPFASLVFLFKFWAQAKTPFQVQLFGVLLMMLTIPLGLRTGMASMKSATPDGVALPAFIGSMEARMSTRNQPEKTEAIADTGPVYVGKTLAEVRELLGEPKGVIASKGRTTYFYPSLELASDDGVRVSYQGVPIQEMDLTPPAK